MVTMWGRQGKEGADCWKAGFQADDWQGKRVGMSCDIGLGGIETLESTTRQSSQEHGLRVRKTGFNVTIAT